MLKTYLNLVASFSLRMIKRNMWLNSFLLVKMLYLYNLNTISAMVLKELLLQQIKIDRKQLSDTALSSSHSMSKSDYLLIANELFDYSSVHVLYNKEISNEEEQVVIVIGI